MRNRYAGVERDRRSRVAGSQQIPFTLIDGDLFGADRGLSLPHGRVACVDGLPRGALIVERVGVDVGRLILFEQARQLGLARSQRRPHTARGLHEAALKRNVDRVGVDGHLVIGDPWEHSSFDAAQPAASRP